MAPSVRARHITPVITCNHRRTGIRAAALSLGALTASLAFAGEIHKCAAGAGVTYQTEPCGDGQTEVAVLATPSRASTVTRDESRTIDSAAAKPPAVRDGAQWLPFRRNAIATGMTDDEVLNTPDGGVPTRISRTREKRQWREVWRYVSRDGSVRELTFANGRLTSVAAGADTAGSLRLASAGNQGS